MICIKAEIPNEWCSIDDELKAIYHTVNMLKAERKKYYLKNYLNWKCYFPNNQLEDCILSPNPSIRITPNSSHTGFSGIVWLFWSPPLANDIS